MNLAGEETEHLTPLQRVDALIAAGRASKSELVALRQCMAPVLLYARHWRRPACLMEVNGADLGMSHAEQRAVVGLAALAEGEFMSRDRLIGLLGSEKSVAARVWRLRQILAAAGATIECVKGVGYRLIDIKEWGDGDGDDAIGAGPEHIGGGAAMAVR